MRSSRVGEIQDRFPLRFEKRGDSECWPWTGTMHGSGYGLIRGLLFGRPTGSGLLSHRAAWLIANGGEFPPRPEGQYHGWVVMHTCDNRLCVNPAHLRLGTQRDNVKDMDSKGRAKRLGLKGSKHHQSVVTEEQAAMVKTDPRSHTEIAKALGLSVATVHYIRRIGWGHVEGSAQYDKGKSRKGDKNANARLTADDVRAIRTSAEKPGIVGARYGILPDYVTSIRKRKAWKHVE